MFRYISNFFRPKNAEQAALIKFRLSVAYAILGWNAFILVFYRLMTRDLPTDPYDQRNAIINKLNPSGKIKIVRIDGLTVVEQRAVSVADLKEEEHLKQSMEE